MSCCVLSCLTPLKIIMVSSSLFHRFPDAQPQGGGGGGGAAPPGGDQLGDDGEDDLYS